MTATTLSARARHGVALFLSGRDGEAAAALAPVAAQTAEPAAWQHLAAALWRAGRRQEALATLTAAVLSAPEQAWAWRHLGAALAADGQGQPALLALSEALALEPDDEASRHLLATLRAEPSVAHPLDADALAAGLSQPPTAELAECLRALGVAALGALMRAEPAGEAGARLILSALGAIAPAVAREKLALWAESEAAATRRLAAILTAELASAAPPAYQAIALALLADDDPSVRRPLAAALLPALLADDAGLARLLGHPAPGVRAEALAHVASAGDPEPLRRVYAAAQDAKVRREALRGFGQMAADDLLALVLWDDTAVLRAEAARLLAEVATAPAAVAAARAALAQRLEVESDALAAEAMAAAEARLAANQAPAPEAEPA
jgi:hypothetical protein